MKRKSKEQIEQERIAREQKRAEALRKRQEQERERAEKQAQQRAEAEHRAWLRKERSRPRVEMPSANPGESIHVHQKVYDRFMKNRGISVSSYRVEGGMGGKLILEYTTVSGGRGRLELYDLGPMPV